MGEVGSSDAKTRDRESKIIFLKHIIDNISRLRVGRTKLERRPKMDTEIQKVFERD